MAFHADTIVMSRCHPTEKPKLNGEQDNQFAREELEGVPRCWHRVIHALVGIGSRPRQLRHIAF